MQMKLIVAIAGALLGWSLLRRRGDHRVVVSAAAATWPSAPYESDDLIPAEMVVMAKRALNIALSSLITGAGALGLIFLIWSLPDRIDGTIQAALKEWWTVVVRDKPPGDWTAISIGSVLIPLTLVLTTSVGPSSARESDGSQLRIAPVSEVAREAIVDRIAEVAAFVGATMLWVVSAFVDRTAASTATHLMLFSGVLLCSGLGAVSGPSRAQRRRSIDELTKKAAALEAAVPQHKPTVAAAYSFPVISAALTGALVAALSVAPLWHYGAVRGAVIQLGLFLTLAATMATSFAVWIVATPLAPPNPLAARNRITLRSTTALLTLLASGLILTLLSLSTLAIATPSDLWFVFPVLFLVTPLALWAFGNRRGWWRHLVARDRHLQMERCHRAIAYHEARARRVPVTAVP